VVLGAWLIVQAAKGYDVLFVLSYINLGDSRVRFNRWFDFHVALTVAKVFRRPNLNVNLSVA
jgi:hypothetical protein